MNGYQRLLGLSVMAEFADPTIERGEIPFTEQVTLGGARPMRAFLSGRLVDRSAAVAQLSYEWPVWVFLDGGLHYAVGNVFGEHLDGFEPGLLRQSFTLGLRSIRAETTFEILSGSAQTFDEGSEIESCAFRSSDQWLLETVKRAAIGARAARGACRLFADVRPGESGTALLLTLNVFLLLVSYYLLKVVREPLILLGGAFGLKGATLKAAAAAAQALLLLAVVPAYGLLANRVNRVRLITTVSGIFVRPAAFYLSRG